jgi:hypothetical protein
MRAIKQYRVKLIDNDEEWQILSNLFEVNSYIERDVITRNTIKMFRDVNYTNTGKFFVNSQDYIVESYDWDKLEFLPSHFGIIKNKLLE